MGVREALNSQPKVVAGVVVAVIVVVAAVMYFTMSDGGAADIGGGGTKAFFSIDDGKSWFVDDFKKVPPFTKDGKEAVRAYVYKCSNGKTFVGYLERYTPSAKKTMEAVHASDGKGSNLLPFDGIRGIEVKAPGETRWMNQSDDKAIAVLSPRCPDGGPAEFVLP